MISSTGKIENRELVQMTSQNELNYHHWEYGIVKVEMTNTLDYHIPDCKASHVESETLLHDVYL